ncbi:conserved hypothetical protein [Ricinus communis]|uniref:Uncharacterized protein n=1 Tax=Ricinus communis TaxID=3988 RepID=B9TQU2_RICCO|nr:conserved hypothetical protein [Ricinus communis]
MGVAGTVGVGAAAIAAVRLLGGRGRALGAGVASGRRRGGVVGGHRRGEVGACGLGGGGVGDCRGHAWIPVSACSLSRA